MDRGQEFTADDQQYGFAIVDYLVCGAVVLLCMGIGLYYAISGGKKQTTSDYLLGNRRLQMLPVAFSLVVSFESSILMMGYPADIYLYGNIVIFSTSANLFTMIYFGGMIAVPLFHPLKITSVYEYLELRYNNRGPRILCTVIGMLYYLFYMGIVLYGPALALQAVMGIPLVTSILAVAFIAMIYTAMGGIRAVIWTDVLQCLVMSIGILAVIVQCAISAGGLQNVWDINKRYKRLDIFETDVTVRHTTWNLMFGSFFRFSGMVFNQSSIQRISSVSSLREAKTIFYIAGPLFFVIGVMINLEASCMFAYFNAVGCDPLESKEISNPNQLIPYLVVRIFRDMPGMSGLYMAALFSATLSTLSSGLSSLSAQMTEDFVKPLFKNMSDIKATVIAKVSVLVFGGLSVAISFLIATVKGSLLQISGSVLTSFGGPAVGMFLYSILCPWAVCNGVLIGGIISMAFSFWLSCGQNFSETLLTQPWLPHNPVDKCFSNGTTYLNESSLHLQNFTLLNSPSLDNYDEIINEFWSHRREGMDKLYALSYTWFGLIAILNVIVLGSIVSLIQGHPSIKDVDVRYILPIGDTIFPYLPKKIRKYMNFGVPFEKREAWLRSLSAKERDIPKNCQVDVVQNVESIPFQLHG